MATVNAVVLKHHKKDNGTWNVKISVSHKSQTRYIETSSFVDSKYIDGKGKLKKVFVERHFSMQLSEYREEITKLGAKVKSMTCEDVKCFLVGLTDKNIGVDLFEVLSQEIDTLKAGNKDAQSYILTSILNHLRDFTKQSKFNIDNFTPGFIFAFEDYLRKDKVITRQKKGGGACRPRKLEGVATNGIINYMCYLSAFLNRLRKKHNNPRSDYFPIPDPFSQYDIPKPTKRNKRNLDIGRICEIKDIDPVGYWETFAKDIFILSFNLCGMNAKDIYVHLTDPNTAGGIEYGRSKVNKRLDGGITNVIINDESAAIISKYAGFIQERYSNHLSMNQALRKGWARLSERLGFKCTLYYARHSFGNIARSVCKFSKDDVSFALNHKYGSDITDVYIEPDWSIVHGVQLAVCKAVTDHQSNNKRVA